MWAAIQASGREMVLTIEGGPDNAACSRGGCGNAHRVGHDITPLWMSVISLVDIASGLWPYASNGSELYGGWWNDLDILEIGNSLDFNCSIDAAALERCRAHFTMWTILKAPLLLGNDLTAVDAATLAVLTNAESIAVNQDALGVQARRVAVQAPRNASLTASPFDNVAVVARCSAAEPTQRWTFVNASAGPADGLYLEPCDAGSAFQQWSAAGGALRNAGADACVDAAGRADPGQVLPCAAGRASQAWAFAATGQIAHGGTCLDVFNFAGPDVFFGGCKAPGDPSISNQVFSGPDANGLIHSLDKGAPANSCLAVSSGPPGGALKTTDAAGVEWCLVNRGSNEGTWGGEPCSARARGGTFVPVAGGTPARPIYDIGKSSWNNQVGASGPWPHTRYVAGGFSWSSPAFRWLANFSTPASPIVADATDIIDDDLVGNVTVGGAFCLQLTTGGLLEVWAAPLTGGRVAVALFNRSPSDDAIVVRWADVGLAPGASVNVRDIWQAANVGTFHADFTRPVKAHATVYLVLTPA